VVVVSYPNLTGFSGVIGIIQIVFVVVVGLYFWNLLRSQQGTRVAVDRESKKELEKIQRLRRISLAEPLAERTRPQRFEEIVGQEEGLKALRAALCGPNPQHVLIVSRLSLEKRWCLAHKKHRH
jgi:Lon-like ATP-dependent protease